MTDKTFKKFTDLNPANAYRKSPVAKSEKYTVQTGSGFNAATTDIIRVEARKSA